MMTGPSFPNVWFALFVIFGCAALGGYVGGYTAASLHTPLQAETVREAPAELVIREIVELQPVLIVQGDRPVAPTVPAARRETVALQTVAAAVAGTESVGDEPALDELARAVQPETPVDVMLQAAAKPEAERPGLNPAPLYPGALAGLAPEEPAAGWWQFRDNMGAGIRGGMGFREGVSSYQGAAYGFWEFLRVRDVYLTGYGEVNTDRAARVQLDMQWRRNK